MADVAIIGLGYVGLSLAMHAVDCGLTVIGVDANPARVADLGRGRSYIPDVSDDQLRRSVGNGLTVRGSFEERDRAATYVICAPTPLDRGRPDLNPLVKVAEDVGSVLGPGCLVCVESTVAPGTTEQVVVPILERESGLKAMEDFHVAYSPERVDPANPVWRLHNTPRLIGGIDEESGKRAALFYSRLCEEVVVLSGVREAEMAKLIENTYRLINIGFVNELTRLGSHVGVDVWEALRGAATKPFGYQPFSPGPGVGGHCIPVDPVYLAEAFADAGVSSSLLGAALEVNRAMPDFVVSRALDVLAERSVEPLHATVHLVGLAYKENVGDLRMSPAVTVARRLRDHGVRLSYTDSLVDAASLQDLALEASANLAEAVETSDLTILLVPHVDLDLDLLALADPPVLDARGVLPPGTAIRI
jgi:nucleotide sugar dehydrogenase